MTSPIFLTQMLVHALRGPTFLEASMINHFLSALLVPIFLNSLSTGPDHFTINLDPNAPLAPKSRGNLATRLQFIQIILVQLRPGLHPHVQTRHVLVLLHHRYQIATGSRIPLLRHLLRLQSRNSAIYAARKTITHLYLKWHQLQRGTLRISHPWK